jgi:transcriptional regulator with XRE-family HTH domain
MDQNTQKPEQIGGVLREKRKAMGLTQDELAQKMGVRRQTLADLELGKNVGSHLLINVMTYLGVTVDSLITASNQQVVGQLPVLVKEDAGIYKISDKFDYPYDWSNPGHLPDEVLIMKVLKRLRFADIVRLCKRFGVERIDQEITSDFYDDVRDDLLEIMETIHEAYARKAA